MRLKDINPKHLKFLLINTKPAHYVCCMIFNTEKHMTRIGISRNHIRREYLAAYSPTKFKCKPFPRSKTYKGVGLMLFYASQLSMHTLSHECLHAAIEYLRFRKYKVRNIADKTNSRVTEEALCDVQSFLLHDLVIYLRRKKLIR